LVKYLKVLELNGSINNAKGESRSSSDLQIQKTHKKSIKKIVTIESVNKPKRKIKILPKLRCWYQNKVLVVVP
jgi:hypothetical protein